MTGLERRCRLLLGVLPRHLRTDRGEELLATLLDSAEPGRRWSGAADACSVACYGARSRVRLAVAVRQTPAWRGGTAMAGMAAMTLLGAVGLTVFCRCVGAWTGE